MIRYEKEPDSPLIRDIQAFLSLDPQAEPERRFDNDAVIFPELEAADEFERWQAFSIISVLYQQMEQYKVTGTPPLTPADVRGQMDVHLSSERLNGLLPDFQLGYLKGALCREIAWQDDMKHYDENPALSQQFQLPDWYPLLTLVEQALQEEQQ